MYGLPGKTAPEYRRNTANTVLGAAIAALTAQGTGVFRVETDIIADRGYVTIPLKCKAQITADFRPGCNDDAYLGTEGHRAASVAPHIG